MDETATHARPKAATRIGWVGLGHMGAPMAANIVRRGASLTVHDLRWESVCEFGSLGATMARSVTEVAAACDVMCVCLPNRAASEHVAAEVFSAPQRPSVYVDLSTLAPDVVQQLSVRATAADIRFIDAPVSGGVRARTEGTLTVMAGGAPAAFELARPVLDLFASKVVLLGPVGAGSTAKIANNLIALTKLVTALEGLLLGIRGGLEIEALCDAIMSSSGACSAVLNMTHHYRARRDGQRQAAHAAISIVLKDLELAVDLAQRHGLPVRTARAALDAWQEAAAAGFADAELWALIDYLDSIHN